MRSTDRAAGLLRAAVISRPARTGSRAFAATRHAWRSSLQVRMVTLTLVISGLLVGGFGAVLASQITEGLVRDTVRKAADKVAEGGQFASTQLASVTDPTDNNLAQYLSDLLKPLADQASGVTVVIEPAPDTAGVDPASLLETNRPDLAARISPQLHQLVGVQQMVAHQFVTVGGHPLLVYGRPVPVSFGVFELYYIFPLDAEADAASLVRNTVIVTGTALVLLLALLAALTTRLVVRPVRVAARTAQRLSAGLLDQRMEIHGEDDL
ncbi:MAG: two-component sensor histidine kinase, partial [Micromonosporaceae bacterium]|nr:two-component sensor histidine kinase [Micromonosporaceae bacterium]